MKGGGVKLTTPAEKNNFKKPSLIRVNDCSEEMVLFGDINLSHKLIKSMYCVYSIGLQSKTLVGRWVDLLIWIALSIMRYSLINFSQQRKPKIFPKVAALIYLFFWKIFSKIFV